MPTPQQIFDEIERVAGEHCSAYVFVAILPHETEDTGKTIQTHNGGVTTAVGLLERAKQRYQIADLLEALRSNGDGDGI